MTTEPTDGPQINVSDDSQNQNDLTRIRGIGQVKQQWLQELLHIGTIQDLATASINEIEAAFAASRAVGRNVLRREIEEWVMQAQALMAERSDLPSGDLSAPIAEAATVTPTQMDVPVNLSTSESFAAPETLMQMPVGNQADDGDTWEAIADFNVTVQTRQMEGQVEYQATFHNLIANATETQSSAHRKPIQLWLVEQVERLLPERLSAETTPTELRLRIGQIHLFQSPESNAPITVDVTLHPGNQPQSVPTLIANQPFAIVLSLQLTGTIATPAAHLPLTYRVEASLRNLIRRTTVSLGGSQHGELTLKQRSYLVPLPEMQLSSGGYRLQVVAMLEGAVAMLEHVEIPLLQVL